MTLPTLLRREPLVHFLLIALFLFVADGLLNGDRREEIRVDANTLDYLVKQRSEIMMRELSNEERSALLDNHIEEEVLVREAYERGLDKGGRMRRQLVRKMRAMLAEDVPEPTEADLRAFFEAYPERYRLPPRISFQHVFFSAADKVPQDLSSRLNLLPDLPEVGGMDPVLGRVPKERSERELATYLGKEAADTVFAIMDDAWHGPINTARGVHFVRITERLPARQPDFKTIAGYLVQDWQLSRKKAAMADKVAAFRSKYRIVTPDSES